MSDSHSDGASARTRGQIAPFAEAPVLVAGASGYVGARLVPRLLDAGYAVRCLARSPQKLERRSWSRHPHVEIVRGDLCSNDELASLMRGCGAAFHLVHSLGSSRDEDHRRDVESAGRLAHAASEAGLARIIYLGGLRETAPGAAPHVALRNEVGRILAAGDVPATILRAAMILGSGSVSFEILRYLVQRQPLMVTPRWVGTEIQPIAISNVLHYLVKCLSEPQTVGRTLDIGGPDILSYRELMGIMAEELGLPRRRVIRLPIEARGLSAWFIGMITPVSRQLVGPLADGLAGRVVCDDDEAAILMPQRLLSARESIRSALRQDHDSEVESAWSDAGVIPGDPDWAGGRVFRDERRTGVEAPAPAVFRAACRLGGKQGYHAGGFLWTVRGSLDELAGGPGLLRGRRDPNALRYGDAVDFWRVTGIEPGRWLRLSAEMKVPGHARLEFVVEPTPQPGGRRSPTACVLTQTATFLPRGLTGLAYWYSMLPFHAWIFRGMLRGIKEAAESEARMG